MGKNFVIDLDYTLKGHEKPPIAESEFSSIEACKAYYEAELEAHNIRKNSAGKWVRKQAPEVHGVPFTVFNAVTVVKHIIPRERVAAGDWSSLRKLDIYNWGYAHGFNDAVREAKANLTTLSTDKRDYKSL